MMYSMLTIAGLKKLVDQPCVILEHGHEVFVFTEAMPPHGGLAEVNDRRPAGVGIVFVTQESVERWFRMQRMLVKAEMVAKYHRMSWWQRLLGKWED